MLATFEQIKQQVNTLSSAERAELAYLLLTSLEPEEEGAAEAWDAEIARRATEIRAGHAAGRNADEVMAEFRERYP